MTRWFGEPWPDDWRTHGRAPVCLDDKEHAWAPLGEACAYCGVPIKAGDRGVLYPHLAADRTTSVQPWHLQCVLRNVGIGGDEVLG